MTRHALSLVEVLVGAVIIGVSALPILELVRSGTARLEVTEVEVAARQLGSDVLERLAGPRLDHARGLTDVFQNAVVGQGLRWSDVVTHDAALARSFPKDKLASLFDLHDVRIRLELRRPFQIPGRPASDDLEAWLVTVSWADRDDHRKEVTFARLIEH